MNLETYLSENTDNPLILAAMVGEYSPVCTLDFQKKLSDYLINNNGTLDISPRIWTHENNVEVIRNICTSLYIEKEYEYTTLYKTLNLSYNPIENYNMVESGKDVTEGKTNDEKSTTDKFNEGEQTTTNNFGERVTTNDVGEQTTTNNTGEQTIINDYGEQLTTNKVSAFDSSEFSDDTQTQADGKTDTTTNGDRTDSVVNGARSDSTKSDAYTDKRTLGARNDTREVIEKNSLSNDVTLKHDLSRSGNIGVTTTQQMIEQERNVAMFSYLSIIAHDVIKRICVAIY